MSRDGEVGRKGGRRARVGGGLQPVSPKRCPLPISKHLVNELMLDWRSRGVGTLSKCMAIPL